MFHYNLHLAVIAFSAGAGVAGIAPIAPTELLVKDGDGEILDQRRVPRQGKDESRARSQTREGPQGICPMRRS